MWELARCLDLVCSFPDFAANEKATRPHTAHGAKAVRLSCMSFDELCCRSMDTVLACATATLFARKSDE